ncbi:hypothetical protein K505DRAFT_369151, partial [Melanomma pulvis-pyrius CBS 109.77]
MADEAVEAAESIDRGSPRAASPAATATVTGVCKRCQSAIGDFFNSWHRITGSYYLPAMLGSYSSTLREYGEQQAALIATDLDGCLIQPLACPSCSDLLGFTAVDAPAAKQSYRGRDFFKLPRIELRCKSPSGETTVVEPKVDFALEPLPVEDSPLAPSSPVLVRSPPVPVKSAPADDMEVDTRPVQHASQPQLPSSGLQQHHHHRHDPHHEPLPPPPPPPPQQQQQHHHQHHHHHQPLRQVEGNRQSLPPPAVRSPTGPAPLHLLPQKSPSNPLPSPSPAVKPVHDVQYAQPQHPPPKDASVGLTNRTRDLPPVMSHVHSPVEQHRTNGQHYPRPPQEVQIDVLERLQTQISQNSSVLTVHGRDMRRYEGSLQHQEENLRREFQGQLHHQNSEIHRVDEAVVRLQHEMRGIRELLEALSREVQASREVSARGMNPRIPGAPMSAQDTALELMADQVSVVSQKANEVDTLKITIEIMKNKIQRLEEAAAAAPA